MKMKNNSGITGVDITISIIILVLFISLITNMFYNVGITSKKVSRKSEATYLAIQVIEALKQIEYDQLPLGETEENKNMTLDELNLILETAGKQKIELQNGYSLEINVENYRNQEGDNTLLDIIKVVTAKVNYTERKKQQSIELSTAVVREGAFE